MSLSQNIPTPTHTLCLITFNNHILLLHRNNPPNQGMWNGVGGRIEKNESAAETCIREAYEETGLRLKKIIFGGLLTWQSPYNNGALALYTAESSTSTTIECDEGKLSWKTQSWAFKSNEVVQNLHIVGPLLINKTPPQIYHFKYDLLENIIHYQNESWNESINKNYYEQKF